MKWLFFGVALLPLALGGCAGQRLFDDRHHAAASEHGVNARWLDDLHARELRGTNDAASLDAIALTKAQDAINPDSTLDDLIAFALANHPSVQSAYAQWTAARQRIVQAHTLPDPQLSYGIMVEQIDQGSGGRDPIGHGFGVSQTFPWFGKLDVRADVQSEAARAAQQRLIAEQVRVARAVKDAYAEYAYTSLALDIVEQHRELWQSVEEVVRIRYRGAEATLADLLRVQADGDQLDVELRDLADVLDARRAHLNAAIGRPSTAPLPAAQRVPHSTIDADDQQLIALLLTQSPELHVQHAEIATRRQAIRAARLDYFPDVMLGVEYGLNTARRMARMDGGGSDTLTGMISINVPIWREKYDAGVREALAEFGAALKTLSGRQYDLEADLKTALYARRDAQRRIDLYGDVLRARGEQILQTTLSGYRTGEATFTDLVQAQRELLAFELAHERALADRFVRTAEIEALLGGPFVFTAAASTNMSEGGHTP